MIRNDLPRRIGVRSRRDFATISESLASRLLNDHRRALLGDYKDVWGQRRRNDPTRSQFTTLFRLKIDREAKAPSFDIRALVKGIENQPRSPNRDITSSPDEQETSFPLTWSDKKLPPNLFNMVSQSLRFVPTTRQKEQLQDSLNALWQAFKQYEAEDIQFYIEDYISEDLDLSVKLMTVDTDALVRQPTIAGMRKNSLLTHLEEQAEKDGLIYAQLNGNIGCIVNGAGLAMATNDILKHLGGEAANFLDTGGQATTDLLVKAFALLLADTRVKAILVNIFGGIIRCDMIAESVIRAAKELDLKDIPVVVRLRGTNEEIGQKMIAESGLTLYSASKIDEAAKQVIELATTGPRLRRSARIPSGTRQFSMQRSLRDSERRRWLLNFNLDRGTKLIYQGFTGKVATSNAQATIQYGTNVVGGVSPGKGGTRHLDLPVYNDVLEAVDVLDPDMTAIFVPALQAKKAILEAIEAEVPLIVSVAEGIPLHDMLHVHEALRLSGKSKLIGPNCPGIIDANTKVRVGIMPFAQFSPGCIAIISKSGTLSYEAVGETTQHGLGQSVVLGIGGDMLPGTSMVDALSAILPRKDTRGLILIGEIGGTMEIQAAEWLKANNSDPRTRKPVVGLIAGHTAPQDRVMGHAGAIRRRGDLTAQQKSSALADAGVVIVQHTGQLATQMKVLLESEHD